MSLLTAYLKEHTNRLSQQAKSSTPKDKPVTTPLPPLAISNKQRGRFAPIENALAHAINEWWEQVPVNRRQTDYHISEIIKLASLKGRWSEDASPIWVGKALRKLGWSVFRNEKVGQPRCRLWTPPKKEF